MNYKSCYIIGNPNSIFTHQLAEKIVRNSDLEVTLLSRSRVKGHNVLHSFNIVCTKDFEGKILSLFLALLKRFLAFLEWLYIFLNIKKYYQALGNGRLDSYKPKMNGSIISFISINNYLKGKDVDILFIQEAFAYGLVGRKVKARKKIIYPWGGDIFNYSFTSKLAYHFTKKNLKSYDKILSGSDYAREFLIKNYNLSSDRIHTTYWIEKPVLSEIDIALIKRHYNIPEDKVIIMNLRRFSPQWGSRLILEAFIKIAIENNLVHFILLNGNDINNAIRILSRLGILEKFTVFNEYIPIQDVWNLMYASDIGVSSMLDQDLISASIIQAIYLKTAVIINNSPCYQELKNYNISVFPVDPTPIDIEQTVNQLINKNIRDENIEANTVAIEEFFNKKSNATNLMKEILY